MNPLEVVEAWLMEFPGAHRTDRGTVVVGRHRFTRARIRELLVRLDGDRVGGNVLRTPPTSDPGAHVG